MKNPLVHISILVFPATIIFNLIIAPLNPQTGFDPEAEKIRVKKSYFEINIDYKSFSSIKVKNLYQLTALKSGFNKANKDYLSSFISNVIITTSCLIEDI